jgi:hypothetical protein
MALLTDGQWTIEKMGIGATHPGYRSRRSFYVSLVKHVCYPEGRRHGVPTNVVHQVVCYPDEERLCWRCGEVIPGGLVACWKMQNWEVLQYGG